MTPVPDPRRRGLLAGLRASFLTGLIVVLPIGLTFYLVWAVIGWIDGWILPLIPGPWRPEVLVPQIFGPDATFPVRGVGVIVFLVFTIMIGWVAKGIIGRSMISRAERMVDRMPIVRSLYNGIKQIAETLFTQGDSKFDRACLVEYPMKGVWCLAFVSGRAKGEIAPKLEARGMAEVMTVFMPMTPNPTAGFLMYLPESDLIYLDMSVEDAAKLLLSAGLVYPNGKDQPPVALANPKA